MNMEVRLSAAEARGPSPRFGVFLLLSLSARFRASGTRVPSNLSLNFLFCKTLEDCYSVSNVHAAFELGQIPTSSNTTIYRLLFEFGKTHQRYGNIPWSFWIRHAASWTQITRDFEKV